MPFLSESNNYEQKAGYTTVLPKQPIWKMAVKLPNWSSVIFEACFAGGGSLFKYLNNIFYFREKIEHP